jgi:hypothetical protein
LEFRFLRNVLLKGLVLFLILDLAFATLPTGLGDISLYNHLFPGRLRFPFGEDSSQSYNLSLFNLDAMFASHVIAGGPKPADEYRVIVLGDSSVWGTLLHPEDTLSGQLDAAGLSLCGKTVHAYNLGYPSISLTKDLMVLDYAKRYHPDFIIWFMTLEAFPADKQLSSPIVANNAARVEDLSARYNLPFDPYDPALVHPDFWDATLIGQRRALADMIRLQMYGAMWSATGIDQTYPVDFQRAQTDLISDNSYHDMRPPILESSDLSFGTIEGAFRIAGATPLLLINEPILISVGKNSNIRYNFFYPRWAFDQWRQMMDDRSASGGWNYLDLWNIVPASEFTNSAIHLTPAGESIVTKRIETTILKQSCP